jgi:hypothetical protein
MELRRGKSFSTVRKRMGGEHQGGRGASAAAPRAVFSGGEVIGATKANVPWLQ